MIQRVLLVCIVISFFTIPYPIKIHNGAMLVAISVALIYTLQRRRYFSFNAAHFFFISGSFWLACISLIYSERIVDGFRDVETMVPALLWPLLFFANRDIRFGQNDIDSFFKALAVSVVCCCFYCHFQAVLTIVDKGHPLTDLFTYYQFQTTYLADPVGLHPTYFSIFIIVSFFALLRMLQACRRKTYKALIVIALMYLLLFLIQMASRAAMLAFILVLIISGLYLIVSRRKYLVGLMSLLLIFALCAFVFLFSENVRYKFYSDLVSSFEHSEESGPANSVALHYRSWACSIEVLDWRNVWFGVGLGDEKPLLTDCYRSHGWSEMVAEDYNSHNQYLTQAVQMGISGCIYLVAFLVFCIWLAIRSKDFFMLGVVLVFSICFLGESVLERQKGITSFYLFMSALIHRHLR